VEPKVSVVMAVYNGEKYLREAIESVLDQTFKDFEYIIINDGSTDQSLPIIKSYDDKRIVVIDQENSGVAKSRNLGVKTARSDFIAILDADDLCLKERLEKQYNFLKNHQDYAVVGSNAENIDKDGNFVCYSDVQTLNDEIQNSIKNNPSLNPIINPSVMFKKSAFLKAGQYAEYMENTYEDLILYNRIVQYGKMANLPDNLIKYRISPGSLNIRSNSREKELYKIISTAINFNRISDIDYLFLKNRLTDYNPKEKTANYHLYLAKKYLWNNYQPKLARKNVFKALRLMPFSIKTYPYFGLTFFPKQIILNIYKIFKRN